MIENCELDVWLELKGLEPTLKGFNYIKDYIKEDEFEYITEFYKYLGEKYETKYKNIERDIGYLKRYSGFEESNKIFLASLKREWKRRDIYGRF